MKISARTVTSECESGVREGLMPRSQIGKIWLGNKLPSSWSHGRLWASNKIDKMAARASRPILRKQGFSRKQGLENLYLWMTQHSLHI